MQYRKDRYGNNISVLGYGCMRFTASGGKIDLDKAEKEVKAGRPMWQVRIAVSGCAVTPGGPGEIMEILGKDESLARIDKALLKLAL